MNNWKTMFKSVSYINKLYKKLNSWHARKNMREICCKDGQFN